MKKLTRSRFESLSRMAKVDAYFSHELNTTIGRNRSICPTYAAQAAFWNNWQQAFWDFADRLSGYEN